MGWREESRRGEVPFSKFSVSCCFSSASRGFSFPFLSSFNLNLPFPQLQNKTEKEAIALLKHTPSRELTSLLDSFTSSLKKFVLTTSFPLLDLSLSYQTPLPSFVRSNLFSLTLLFFYSGSGHISSLVPLLSSPKIRLDISLSVFQHISDGLLRGLALSFVLILVLVFTPVFLFFFHPLSFRKNCQ